MADYKGVAVAFVVLTIVFAAGTGYLLAFPRTKATTTTEVVTTTQSVESPYTVNVAYKASLGYYLTNGTGFTLYTFSGDTPGNGSSACSGSCASVWPPFYASVLKVPTGLNTSSFSVITRPDGSKQTTYNGWPLYYFSPDKAAGSTLGEGINHFGGLWFATPPTIQRSGGQILGGPAYSLGIAYKTSIGLYLTNSAGFTLYFRSTDTANSGKTTCDTALCEGNWPAFYAPSLSLPPGLAASSFSVINPYNSTKITTFDGYALFAWIHDAAPGQTTGEGIGGFYVATLPALEVPTTTTTA